MKLIDISPLVHDRIPVWPGDVPFKLGKTCTFEESNLDLGFVHTTLHVGSHTDAPMHYHPNGMDIADVPLDAYYGPCQVIEVNATRGERFGWEDLRQQPKFPRILFKTGTFPDPDNWNDDFAAPEPELLQRLAAQGVVLVGFDTPSTDLFHSKGLSAHQVLFGAKMANLEGLVLADVAPGTYTLSAFPLKLRGADASPVRAVLIAKM